MRVRPIGVSPLLIGLAILAGQSLPSAAYAYNPGLDRQLLARAAEATPAELTKLIHAGANVNTQDQYGVTPLMQAVIGNNVAVVRILITNGADLKLRDYRGDNAFDLAQQLNRNEIAQILATHMKELSRN